MSNSTYNMRVYYEDTDAGGVVYYANYLKFAERARTEMLRANGIQQSELREKYGVLFVVTRCEIDFKKPARLDDILTIDTRITDLGKVRLSMHQTVRRGEDMLAELVVHLACVNENGKPSSIPGYVAQAFTPRNKPFPCPACMRYGLGYGNSP